MRIACSLLGFCMFVVGCRSEPPLGFGGRVVTPSGTPIEGAEVQVGEVRVLTDDEGLFQLDMGESKTGQYLLSIRRTGYGLLSRHYRTPVPAGRWVLTPGTTRVFAPDAPIELSDESDACAQSEALLADFGAFPRRALPRLSGNLGDGAMPQETADVLAFLFGGPACSPGASVYLAGGQLVDADGAPPKSPVTVTIATVDRFAPYSMPGAGSVATESGTARIETWGAVTVNLEADGKPYQLAPGATANISIPVRGDLANGGDISWSIPLLLYDEDVGIWRDHGTADFDPDAGAYVASVDHLSTFNTDRVKQNQSCLRIDANPLANAGVESFTLDVFFPVGSGAPEYRNFDVVRDQLTGDHLHAIINLPPSVVVTLVASQRVGDDVLPIGIFSSSTGAPMPPGSPERPPYPYVACSNVVSIEPPVDEEAAATLQVNGSAPPPEVRPIHTYSLVRGTDIYPVGPGELYLFGLFDTGSDRVFLPIGEAQTWAIPLDGPPAAVDIRLNGLARINEETLGAPGFSPDFPAEHEVNDIQLRVGTGPSIPLIGTPVAAQSVVYIEPYTTVTRGPYPTPMGEQSVSAMHMAFLDPAAAPAESTVSIALESIEGEPFADGTTRGPRFALRSIVFSNEGANFTDIMTTNRFLFDTGTQFTIVNVELAQALGIELGVDGVYDCFDDVEGAEGYLIDRIDFVDREDPDNAFRVAPALVCVDRLDNKIVLSYALPNGAPTKFDAVIGMNPFASTRMVLHGIEGWLGVAIPESAPP